MMQIRDGASVQHDAAGTGKCVPKRGRLQPEFVGEVKNLVEAIHIISDLAIGIFFLYLDSSSPLGNTESRIGARGALIEYFLSASRDLKEDSIAQYRPKESLGFLLVDIFEQKIVHVRLSIQDSEDWEDSVSE